MPKLDGAPIKRHLSVLFDSPLTNKKRNEHAAKRFADIWRERISWKKQNEHIVGDVSDSEGEEEIIPYMASRVLYVRV